MKFDRILIAVLLGLFGVLGCKPKNSKINECKDQVFFDVSMAIDDADISHDIEENEDSFFNFLDNSDFMSAQTVLNNKVNTVYTDDNNITYNFKDERTDSNKVYYLVYRISEFLSNINYDALSSILIKSLRNNLTWKDSPADC